MSLFGIIVVFVLAWWLIFIAVLPWGVRRNLDVDAGHDAGAPAHSRLGPKVAATTAIAAAVTGMIWLIITSDLVSFRE
jgi:predicted secreted protein